ncbi:hypothetical protein DV737_g3885, partial [Chaetothyriales sp. CBS 132003]
MRFSAVLSFICAAAALTLSLLCLFAGSSKPFLQSGDILTLNVSRIGHGSAFNTSDGDDGLLSTLTNDLEADINSLLDKAADEVADALNLTDFYSVHIMNYCQGFFEPNSTARHASKNTTFCSSKKALFHFNATETISNSLPDNISLSEIHWPDEIEDATTAVRVASIVMFVFYVIGIACAGLATISAVLAVVASGRLSAGVNFLLDIIAFLALGIASAIATAGMFKAVHAINKYGHDIGISATRGATFLGLTWGATAAALVASLLSIVQCMAGRKHKEHDDDKLHS